MFSVSFGRPPGRWSRALLAALVATFAAAAPAGAATYDIVAQFGAPVFSYGTLSAAGGFTAFAHEPAYGRCAAHPEWDCYGGPEDYHHVVHTYSPDVPGTILMHTGPVSNVVLRFTAPVAGSYSFAGTAQLIWGPQAFGDGTRNYFHLSSDPATYTLAADTTTPNQIVPFSGLFALAVGDSVDIVSDKIANYYYDDTLFTGSFVGGAVPEPAAWALLLWGFGLTGTALRRRGGPARVSA